MSAKLGEKFKGGGKFESSPDVRKYPFVLGFRTKDISKQQENDLKNALLFGSK